MIRLQHHDFNISDEIDKLYQQAGIGQIGAISSFIGCVRSDKNVIAIDIEHYPKMTEQSLLQISNAAHSRWSLQGVTIIHRIGRINLGEQIVLVAALASHRTNAIAATTFIMDKLKTEAMLWKQEIFSDNRKKWVEQKHSDMLAAQNWQ